VASAGLELLRLPILRDNYVWLLRCTETGATAVVDPGEAEPVQAALHARGWRLDLVLNTHHHADHVGGNRALKQAWGARIIGPVRDRARIPGMDQGVDQDETVQVGAATATVHFVPGHTAGHIAYHFGADRLLFCGDTLFLSGCGRIFEGTAPQLWDSLRRLRDLPDDTAVCCAHEYTLANVRFACGQLPADPAVLARAEAVQAARAQDRPTVPASLGQEKACNLFLRADEPAVAQAMGLPGAPPDQVFAELRGRKDRA